MNIWNILVHINNPEHNPYYINYTVKADKWENAVNCIYDDNLKICKKYISFEKFVNLGDERNIYLENIGEDIKINFNMESGILCKTGRSYYLREQNL